MPGAGRGNDRERIVHTRSCVTMVSGLYRSAGVLAMEVAEDGVGYSSLEVWNNHAGPSGLRTMNTRIPSILYNYFLENVNGLFNKKLISF